MHCPNSPSTGVALGGFGRSRVYHSFEKGEAEIIEGELEFSKLALKPFGGNTVQIFSIHQTARSGEFVHVPLHG